MRKYKVSVVDKDGKTHTFERVVDYFHQNGHLKMTLENGESIQFDRVRIQETEINESSSGKEKINS